MASRYGGRGCTAPTGPETRPCETWSGRMRPRKRRRTGLKKRRRASVQKGHIKVGCWAGLPQASGAPNHTQFPIPESNRETNGFDGIYFTTILRWMSVSFHGPTQFPSRNRTQKPVVLVRQIARNGITVFCYRINKYTLYLHER